MAVINAVATVDYLEFLAKHQGGLIAPPWTPTLTHFRFGEGGWIDNGAGPEARVPVGTLRRVDNIQDIDAIVDPTRPLIDQRYPVSSLFSIQKAFVGGDLVFEAPGTIRCRCFLDFAEGNDTGTAEYWEVGVYAVHPTVGGQKLLVAYGTFSLESKTIGVQLEHFVRLNYGAVPPT